MLRTLVSACAILALCIGVVFAAEIKGKVSKVDIGDKKKVISVTVEGQDKDVKINVGKKTKVVDGDGKEIEAKDIKEGSKITATYEEKEKDGKKIKVWTEVKVSK